MRNVYVIYMTYTSRICIYKYAGMYDRKKRAPAISFPADLLVIW